MSWPNMTDRYPEIPLGNLLTTIIDHRGKTPKKLGGDFTEAGVPVVSAIHIKGGRIKWDERERFVSQAMFEKWMPVRVQRGDLLLTSEAPLGEVALVPNDEDLTLSQRLFALRGDPQRLDTQYLRYFLSSMMGQQRLQERASGSTVLGIRQAELVKVTIPLPPLAEQRRIAGVLGALDDLIEVNRGLIRDLQDLALTRYAEIASSVTESRRLGALASVNAAQVKPKLTGSVTYLDISAVGDAVVDWPAAMDWSAAPSRARRLACAGSTIWSTVRPNRRAHALLTHVPDDLVVSTGFAVLEPRVIGAAEIFCATHGDSFVEYLMSRAEGSAYPAVRGSVFEEAEVPFLGAEASTEFENFAWPLLGAAGELDVESQQLQATRDELLPLLLSGAVTVSEVAA